MKLDNYKKCDLCGEMYNVSPFACMLGNGERADAQINIHGDIYDLCPKCTYKFWELLNSDSKKRDFLNKEK